MICIRASLCRTAAGALLLWFGGACATLFLMSPSLRAQEPQPPGMPQAPAAQPAPGDKADKGDKSDKGGAAAAPAEAAAPEKAADDAKALGTVLVERLQLRCFAGDLSPTYEDTLAQGAVVAVGRVENGFRLVMLPLGPKGYVSKRFTAAAEAGRVKCVGRGVSFRYRPKTGEAPAANLPDAAELHVVGDQGDWWIVRGPMVEAWAKEAEVQVFDQPTETMKLAHAELEKVQRGEVQEYLGKLQAAAEQARRDLEDRDKIAEFSKRLRDESDKPAALQDYAPLEQELAAFAALLPPDSALQQDVKTLQQRITNRKWVAEATAVRNAQPVPPKDLPEMTPLVKDRLDRFDATGWLRYHAVLGRPGHFTIEKGGQILYHVNCTNMRYDLALFIDKEVGLVGPRRRPATESLRVLDIEKIEVLGLPAPR